MNSPVVWLRSFFSWVLVVDTPPYPYESWFDLPAAQWPKGYDPVTDTILRTDTTSWEAGIQSFDTELNGSVKAGKGLSTILAKASRHATNRLRKRKARKEYQQGFAHQ